VTLRTLSRPVTYVHPGRQDLPMTNPPGPGPDPLGQQPYQQPGYPPAGQFPPGQFPPGQFPQYGGYGPPPVPPKKSKTGLWAAVGVVAVLVIALGITGFVAPGFFLTKTGSDAAGVDAAAQRVATAMGAADKATLTALSCHDADQTVSIVTHLLDEFSSAKILGPATKVSDTQYTVLIEVSASNTRSAQVTATLANEDSRWCLKKTVASADSQPPSSAPAPSGEAPVTIPTQRAAMPARTAPLPNPTSCQYPADTKTAAAKPATAPPDGQVPSSGTVPVTLQTSAGDIPLTLDRALAPCTVNNFLNLAKQSFYTGTSCHRLGVDAGLQMLQCGDPTGDGSGGPGYTFADEVFPELTYGRGVLAMANAGPDTNGSQFFLVYGDTQLPPDYTVFGSISDAGLQVLDKVARSGVDPQAPSQAQDGTGKPNIPVKFSGVTVGG
jgi:peptidyl-prolyl cis-trans isomerase B (cyclophilin B)